MPSVPPTATGDRSLRSPGLSRQARVADYSVMGLAVVLGGGSLLLFGLTGRTTLVRMGLSPAAALWWDGLLSLVFFAQHSVMVRRPVRARLAAVVPPRYDGAFYAITSGAALTFFVVLYQPVDEPALFALHGAARAAVLAAAALALAAFAWATLALHTLDAFGLDPIRRHLRGSLPDSRSAGIFPAKAFVVRGPFRWVRHPIYAAVIVLLWATPRMGPGRLELAALWSAWILVGAALEERDLVAEFGEAYRRYRRRVPMLVPWRRPVPGVSATRS
jgi:hypothetical protein